MLLIFERKTDDRGRVSYKARQDGWLFVMTHRLSEALKTFMDVACDTGMAVPVMIIGGLGSHVRGLTVDIVTDEYELVEHTGFECAGTMCSTTAFSVNTTDYGFNGYITPGRCENILPVADNVNVRSGEAYAPRTPGKIYIKKGERRGAGVPSLDEVCLTRHAEFSGFTKAMKERRAA